MNIIEDLTKQGCRFCEVSNMGEAKPRDLEDALRFGRTRSIIELATTYPRWKYNWNCFDGSNSDKELSELVITKDGCNYDINWDNFRKLTRKRRKLYKLTEKKYREIITKEIETHNSFVGDSDVYELYVKYGKPEMFLEHPEVVGVARTFSDSRYHNVYVKATEETKPHLESLKMFIK